MQIASAKKGFTLVEIMIVVAIIGIIIAIAVPAFIRARENARGRACQENLSKVDGAKEQWAIENKKAGSAAVTIGSDLVVGTAGTGYLKEVPVCPSNNSPYTLATVSATPTCSIGTSLGYIPHVLPGAGAI
jgi:prepilin-type N-terminal cleavage/methylation domain-containing protein